MEVKHSSHMISSEQILFIRGSVDDTCILVLFQPKTVYFTFIISCVTATGSPRYLDIIEGVLNQEA